MCVDVRNISAHKCTWPLYMLLRLVGIESYANIAEQRGSLSDASLSCLGHGLKGACQKANSLWSHMHDLHRAACRALHVLVFHWALATFRAWSGAHQGDWLQTPIPPISTK